MAVFWDIVPCSLVAIYRRFRGAYSLYHHGEEYDAGEKVRLDTGATPLKRRPISTRLHGATSQKAVIFILVAVRT
jgi:hypothetical protein